MRMANPLGTGVAPLRGSGDDLGCFGTRGWVEYDHPGLLQWRRYAALRQRDANSIETHA